MKFPKLSSLFRPSAFLVAAVIGLAVVAFLVWHRLEPTEALRARLEGMIAAGEGWQVSEASHGVQKF